MKKLQMLFFVSFIMFSANAFSHDFWLGLGLGLLLQPQVYYAPPPVYYSPPQYYYPRQYCYFVDMGGWYDQYGNYIPNIQQLCR